MPKTATDARQQPKNKFQTEGSLQVLSLHPTVLVPQKAGPDAVFLVREARSISAQAQWSVLVLAATELE